jgi:hypothetical protein
MVATGNASRDYNFDADDQAYSCSSNAFISSNVNN